MDALRGAKINAGVIKVMLQTACTIIIEPPAQADLIDQLIN